MNTQQWQLANRKSVPNGFIADILLAGQNVASVFEADGWFGIDWISGEAGVEIAEKFDRDAWMNGLDMQDFANKLMELN